MASNIDTIMGLVTLLGSSLGLVLGGIMIVALVLRVLDRTRHFSDQSGPAV